MLGRNKKISQLGLLVDYIHNYGLQIRTPKSFIQHL